MIARLALMVSPRHDECMTTFLLLIAIPLVVGFLSLRYGVDSRIDEHARRR
jgi:hypothetical protein